MEPQKQNGVPSPSERKRLPRTYGRKRNKAENPTDIVTTMHRMTQALRTRIEEAATANGRSINAEINWRLLRSFWLDDMLKAKLLSAALEVTAKGRE